MGLKILLGLTLLFASFSLGLKVATERLSGELKTAYRHGCNLGSVKTMRDSGNFSFKKVSKYSSYCASASENY